MRFFMIDRITKWDEGREAEAVKNVALSEDFFDDHFPRHPVMPAVLIVEGMAQVSGLLLEAGLKKLFGKDAKAVLTILEKVKFREMVKPGDTLIYRSRVNSLNEAAGRVSVKAFRGDRQVASTEMVFAFKEVEDPRLGEKRKDLMKLWMETS